MPLNGGNKQKKACNRQKSNYIPPSKIRESTKSQIKMANYEITYIARQEISENDVEKITDSFTKLLSDNGGKVIKTEYWGLRNFAYEIKKAKNGHYAFLGVDAPAPAVKELERNMRLHENVVRFLTIKVDKISREPSAIIRTDVDDDFDLKIETN